MKNVISFGFSFLKYFQTYLQTLWDRFYFRMHGRYFATHITLKARQLGLQWTLKILEQGGFVELPSMFSGNDARIFGCICGAVPNKDISMFLSMLRSPSVCDTVMLLSFLENVSKSGALISSRFPKMSGHEWDKPLSVFVKLIYHSRFCCF